MTNENDIVIVSAFRTPIGIELFNKFNQKSSHSICIFTKRLI